MGLIAEALRVGVQKAAAPFSPVPQYMSGTARLSDARYQTYAREGYMANELVYACIEELSTSAAEPSMMAKVGGAWVKEDRVLTLLNAPNPFMDRFEFWATIIMHRSLAGNAYALKVRSGSGRVVELWLLRPDRVRIVPDSVSYIRRYDYDMGNGQMMPIPVNDVIHFKNRHPLDDFYGMPPLMAISGRTDIDNFMRDFVKSYFMNAGVPGGILSVKQALTPSQRDEIRNRFRETVGGPRGWHEMLILDNSEATFTPMTQQVGTRGLVIPELDEIDEARIPMVFGVPQSLIGTRTSYQNGGYANKRAEEQHFWTGTLTPLYKELAGPLNLRLAPDFFGVQEIMFDLSDVEALQEDIDLVSNRIIAQVNGGLLSWEEGREKLGLPATPPSGHRFFIPTQVEAQPASDVGKPVALPNGGSSAGN